MAHKGYAVQGNTEIGTHLSELHAAGQACGLTKDHKQYQLV